MDSDSSTVDFATTSVAALRGSRFASFPLAIGLQVLNCGRRHLDTDNDPEWAVSSFDYAINILEGHYGAGAKEMAEAYLLYGKALYLWELYGPSGSDPDEQEEDEGADPENCVSKATPCFTVNALNLH
jgi:hypothetical protein